MPVSRGGMTSLSESRGVRVEAIVSGYSANNKGCSSHTSESRGVRVEAIVRMDAYCESVARNVKVEG